jgi:hypothetical protein
LLFGWSCGADLTLFLQAAQLGGGTVQMAQGLSAGAINGVLSGCGGRVEHGIEIAFRNESGFGFGATTKTPGCVDDFRGESDFHGPSRGELVLEVVTEGLVKGYLVGANNVADGIEAECGRVARDARFAFGGTRSGGGLRVAAVGCDLSFCGHEYRFPGISIAG